MKTKKSSLKEICFVFEILLRTQLYLKKMQIIVKDREEICLIFKMKNENKMVTNWGTYETHLKLQRHGM